MNSEKVKEIKKVLEEGQFNTINHHQKEGKPILISFADILTLINELESENERLNECYKVKAYDKLRAENKKLKDRIAELEKEKKELAKQVVKITGCSIDDISAQRESNNKLKQFGKKFELNIGKYLKKKYSDYQQDSFYYIIDKADVDMCLDETLKECLCEK